MSEILQSKETIELKFKHGVTGYDKYKCRCNTCCCAKDKQRANRGIAHRKWRNKNPQYANQYAAKNRKAFKEYKARWKSKNPDAVKRKQRLWSWRSDGININNESYDELLKKQENKCAVCGRCLVEDKSKMVLGSAVAHVDHDHRTGRIRGLLCGSCNRAAGLLADSAERAVSLALYLRN
jgi:hypothetical protein